MLRVTAGHDIEYPLKGAGTAVGYYLQDGLEPPGIWAGKAAEALGLTGQVDPETYRALFGKLIAPTGERLYAGRPPRSGSWSGKPGRDSERRAAPARERRRVDLPLPQRVGRLRLGHHPGRANDGPATTTAQK